jgi:hypothetical protein
VHSRPMASTVPIRMTLRAPECRYSRHFGPFCSKRL